VHVLIDLPKGHPYRVATIDALAHAAVHAGIDPEIREIPTDQIDDHFLADLGDGVIIGPGSPYTNPEGAHEVIRSARQRGVPLVGT
jgi:CTP synthase (UTP-ammonia lyase)